MAVIQREQEQKQVLFARSLAGKDPYGVAAAHKVQTVARQTEVQMGTWYSAGTAAVASAAASFRGNICTQFMSFSTARPAVIDLGPSSNDTHHRFDASKSDSTAVLQAGQGLKQLLQLVQIQQQATLRLLQVSGWWPQTPYSAQGPSVTCCSLVLMSCGAC